MGASVVSNARSTGLVVCFNLPMAVNPAGATTAGRMLLPMLRVMQTDPTTTAITTGSSHLIDGGAGAGGPTDEGIESNGILRDPNDGGKLNSLK